MPQTDPNVANCILNLKSKLAAAGFQVGAGDAVDIQTWQAISVMAGSQNADSLAGKNVTPAMQLATCNALAATLAKQTPEMLHSFIFEQRKRLIGPPGPESGVVTTPVSKGLVAGLIFSGVVLATGFVVAFWPRRN